MADLTHGELFQHLRAMNLCPRRAGNNWQCRCPAHDDRSPSLSIRVADDGRLLAYCHAGCDFLAIVSALGLRSGSVSTAPNGLRLTERRPGGLDYPRLEEWPERVLGGNGAGLDAGLQLADGSLAAIGAGWSDRFGAVAAPMSARYRGDVIGVRLRASDGRKWAVPGSRNGLFCSVSFAGGSNDPVWMPEGMTDSAALAGLGLDVLGRPSADGGVHLAADAVRYSGHRPVVIIADKDGPGVKGAYKLAAAVLLAGAASLRIITPPNGYKDVREWVAGGADADEIRYVARHTAPERQP